MKMDLTPRQRQVLEKVADGCSNLEIAREMWITERTVRTHMSCILGKLSVHNRTQAAMTVWRERVADLERENADLRRRWAEMERYATLRERMQQQNGNESRINHDRLHGFAGRD